MRKAARSELIEEEHEANTFSLFAPFGSLLYSFPHDAREYIVNSRDVAVSFIWYYILGMVQTNVTIIHLTN